MIPTIRYANVETSKHKKKRPLKLDQLESKIMTIIAIRHLSHIYIFNITLCNKEH